MHNQYYFYFNERYSTDTDLKVIKRHSPPVAKKNYREINIEGRDGTLYEDLGTYNDIEISVDVNFKVNSQDEWEDKFRYLKLWLCGDIDVNNELSFSDDMSFFYKVKKVEIDNVERVLKRIGRFRIIFYCEAFKYSRSGQTKRNLTQTVINDYGLIAHPIYTITGSGTCTITCNGKSVSIDIPDYSDIFPSMETTGTVIIDSDLKIAYNTFGYVNSNVTGYFEDLYLQIGNNEFTWTDGFTIQIQQNKRIL